MIGVQVTSLGIVGAYIRHFEDGHQEPCVLQFEQSHPDDPAHSHFFGVLPCVRVAGAGESDMGAFVALQRREHLAELEEDDWDSLAWEIRRAASAVMLGRAPVGLVGSLGSAIHRQKHPWMVPLDIPTALATMVSAHLGSRGYGYVHVVWLGNDQWVVVSVKLDQGRGLIADLMSFPLRSRILQRVGESLARLNGLDEPLTKQLQMAVESSFILMQEPAGEGDIVVGEASLSPAAIKAQVTRVVTRMEEAGEVKKILEVWSRQPGSVFLLLGDLLGTAEPAISAQDLAPWLLPEGAHPLHPRQWLQRGLALGAAYATAST